MGNLGPFLALFGGSVWGKGQKWALFGAKNRLFFWRFWGFLAQNAKGKGSKRPFSLVFWGQKPASLRGFLGSKIGSFFGPFFWGLGLGAKGVLFCKIFIFWLPTPVFLVSHEKFRVSTAGKVSNLRFKGRKFGTFLGQKCLP